MLSNLDTKAAAARISGLKRSPFLAPALQSLSLRTAATLQLGAGEPKPQPLSRFCAILGLTHLPVLRAQQTCW